MQLEAAKNRQVKSLSYFRWLEDRYRSFGKAGNCCNRIGFALNPRFDNSIYHSCTRRQCFLVLAPLVLLLLLFFFLFCLTQFLHKIAPAVTMHPGTCFVFAKRRRNIFLINLKTGIREEPGEVGTYQAQKQ